MNSSSGITLWIPFDIDSLRTFCSLCNFTCVILIRGSLYIVFGAIVGDTRPTKHRKIGNSAQLIFYMSLKDEA